MNETMNRAQISNQENEGFDKSLSPIQNLFWNIPQLFSFEFCDIFQSHFFYKTCDCLEMSNFILKFFVFLPKFYFSFLPVFLVSFQSFISLFFQNFWLPSKIFMLVPFQIFGFFRNFFFWFRS